MKWWRNVLVWYSERNCVPMLRRIVPGAWRICGRIGPSSVDFIAAARGSGGGGGGGGGGSSGGGSSGGGPGGGARGVWGGGRRMRLLRSLLALLRHRRWKQTIKNVVHCSSWLGIILMNPFWRTGPEKKREMLMKIPRRSGRITEKGFPFLLGFRMIHGFKAQEWR